MEKKLVGLMWAIGLVIALELSARKVSGAITCSEAITTLMPCLSFLVGTTPSPPPPCCLAVQKVNHDASTKEDRQQLCQCFKKAAPSFGVDPKQAKKLPDMCSVAVPVPIDPNVDCSKIS